MSENKRRFLMWITRFVAGLVALLLAVTIYQVLVATATQVEPSDEARALPTAPVFSAQRVPVRRQWQGYGTAEAMDAADVPARVTATVTEVPDNTLPGNRVARGQMLVQLDGSDFERQVEIAEQSMTELRAALSLLEFEQTRLDEQLALEEEDLALSRDELGRVKRIQESGATNQQDVDRVRRETIATERQVIATTEAISRLEPRKLQLTAQLASQEASLKLAKQNFERTTITSPIDGVLQSVDIDLGEELRPGIRVARVVNLERIETPLRLPAQARSDMAIGDSATIATTVGGTRRFDATIARIAPVDDVATRTVTVYLVVDQPGVADRLGDPTAEPWLSPGAFVSGTVVSDRSNDRWVVPRRAVRSGRIRVVRDGVVVSQPVTVDFVVEGDYPSFGLPDDQWAVLSESSTLAPGDLVLVNAAMAVLDGDPVEPSLPDGARAVSGGDAPGVLPVVESVTGAPAEANP